MANSHYLVTTYIEQKGLARISREVVFPFLGYFILIGKILQDFKSESISAMCIMKRKNIQFSFIRF